MESDTQSDSDEEDSSATLSYRLKLCAADPRYITSSEDGNRGDVICTVEQVKELIARKAAAEDGIAAIWLTTAEMGFSLTAMSRLRWDNISSSTSRFQKQ